MFHSNNILALVYEMAFGMTSDITSSKQLHPSLDVTISQSKELGDTSKVTNYLL